MSQWMSKPYLILGIGVGVGVITLVVHVLKRQNKEEIVRTEYNRVNRSLKIPKGFVGHVLGRGGSTIKDIREKSKARITFEDSANDYTVATVSGTAEAVEEAVNLINAIISSRHASVTREIILDENLANSVWRNIDQIRRVCDLTRAKLVFDFHPSRGSRDPPLKVLVKGRREEVEAALAMVDELVAGGEVAATKQQHTAGRALPNSLPLHSPRYSSRKDLPCEKLVPNSSDGFIEVYVSAIDTPSKFWAQISGSKSVQLDKLATEMTDFYSDERNKTKFQLSSISVGDIVTAFFQEDSSWYRAQVIKVTEDGNDKKIAVFYLDFGDCAILTANLVCVLKPDYLSIPFQAIECSLAGVEPLDGKWTVEASDEFQKMVYLGQWKVIMAKPVSESISESQNSVQCVMLLDTNSSVDVNIAEELVLKDFAKFVE